MKKKKQISTMDYCVLVVAESVERGSVGRAAGGCSDSLARQPAAAPLGSLQGGSPAHQHAPGHRFDRPQD